MLIHMIGLKRLITLDSTKSGYKLRIFSGLHCFGFALGDGSIFMVHQEQIYI